MPDQQINIEIRVCKKCGSPKNKFLDFVLDNRKKPTWECRSCGRMRQVAWASAKRATSVPATVADIAKAIADNRDDLMARLFARRIVTATRCWEWTGGRRGKYGKIEVAVPNRRPAQVSTHRLSAILFGVLDPLGPLLACHGCDNPPCFRPGPGHLFSGTSSDNYRDALAKGLIVPPSGENHQWAVLKLPQVVEIKKRLAAGEACVSIAKDFPAVTVWAIYTIKYGNSWRAAA